MDKNLIEETIEDRDVEIKNRLVIMLSAQVFEEKRHLEKPKGSN